MAGKSVITGIGVLSPNGVGKDAFLDAIRNGKSGVRKITHLDTATLHSRIAGSIDDETLQSLSPGEESASDLDRTALFARIAGEMALADAQLDKKTATLSYKKGIIIGTGSGPLHTVERFYEERFLERTPYVRPSTLGKAEFASPCAGVAARFGIDGIVQTVSAGCASSLAALTVAHSYIRMGMADILLVGGVDCPLTQHSFRMWDSLRLLTRDFNNAPESASRPFALGRSGMVLSEGCGFVVMEREEVAAERGAEVYADFLGGGFSYDPEALTNPGEDFQVQAMKSAIFNAKAPQKEIGYVQASGASVHINDLVESRAIRRTFGDRTARLPVSSIKSMIGHAAGASGMLSLIAVILGMRDKFLPPTINLDAPDPECDLDHVANAARPVEVKTALVNSFGVTGANASVVVRKATKLESTGAAF
jgi:3-oxoacyl-[acyl-carrier-protein] synthase II